MSRAVPILIPVPDALDVALPFPFGPPPRPAVREWSADGPLQPICFVVGVDLGQARDFSTIVINEVNFAERTHFQQAEFQPVPGVASREKLTHHRLRHVERIPLGTSYPDVLARVASVMERVPPMPRPPALVMDATGCGRPVMDLAGSQAGA